MMYETASISPRVMFARITFARGNECYDYIFQLVREVEPRILYLVVLQYPEVDLEKLDLYFLPMAAFIVFKAVELYFLNAIDELIDRFLVLALLLKPVVISIFLFLRKGSDHVMAMAVNTAYSSTMVRL